MTLLIEPARTRLLRKIEPLFVETLKDAMIKNPSSDSAPLVGLIGLREGKQFDATKSHTYEYETIGGNNSRQALQVSTCLLCISIGSIDSFYYVRAPYMKSVCCF